MRDVEPRRLRDPPRRAVESLREDFPGKYYSWIRKALLRLGNVKEGPSGLYLVHGHGKLGGWRPLYQVWSSEREGRWLCTCHTSALGLRRLKEICTHIVAVMLHRRYTKALQKAENKRVCVAETEVECRGHIETNGDLYPESLMKARDGAVELAFFTAPRHHVSVVSERRIVIKCGGHVLYEIEGEEMPMAVAKFSAERP